MIKKQSSIPILELANYEPETKQENFHTPSLQSRNRQSKSVSKRSTPEILRTVLSQFISRDNRSAVASIITLVGVSGFLMFKFLPISSEREIIQQKPVVKSEAQIQELASGMLADLVQKHAKEKSALLDKQNEMITQIKVESDKRIALERAEIVSETRKRKEKAKKYLEERLSKQEVRMLLEKKRFAEQLEKDMRSKFVAQQQESANIGIQSEEQIDQVTNVADKNPETTEKSFSNVIETNPERSRQQRDSADSKKKDNEQLLAAQTAKSVANQKARKEREQSEIQERLEKQQAIFLAELNKLANKQTQEIQSLKSGANMQTGDIKVLTEGPAVNTLFSRMETGNITYLQKFLMRGGNPNQFNHQGQSLLTKAAAHDQYIMTTELLRAGAKVNLPDMLGMSPLIYGSSYGNTGIVELLVSNGANVNYLSPQSESALIYATKNGHLEIVDLLIRAGANVNVKDNEGRTALFFATKNNDNAATSLLLENGADRTPLQSEGTRVLDTSRANDIAFN